MSIEEILESWKRSRAISPCITDLRIFKKTKGQYRPFPDFLHPLLRESLKREGIDRLYSHQAEAIELIQKGKNVVVVTPTASGKTLCYNLPVLNSKLDIPFSKAFYLFPTKALSKDQSLNSSAVLQRLPTPRSWQKGFWKEKSIWSIKTELRLRRRSSSSTTHPWSIRNLASGETILRQREGWFHPSSSKEFRPFSLP